VHNTPTTGGCVVCGKQTASYLGTGILVCDDCFFGDLSASQEADLVEKGNTKITWENTPFYRWAQQNYPSLLLRQSIASVNPLGGTVKIDPTLEKLLDDRFQAEIDIAQCRQKVADAEYDIEVREATMLLHVAAEREKSTESVKKAYTTTLLAVDQGYIDAMLARDSAKIDLAFSLARLHRCEDLVKFYEICAGA
jgi:hypothetical protein